MDDRDDTAHGTTAWIPPGHLAYIWPKTDTATTEAIEELGVIRGAD